MVVDDVINKMVTYGILDEIVRNIVEDYMRPYCKLLEDWKDIEDQKIFEEKSLKILKDWAQKIEDGIEPPISYDVVKFLNKIFGRDIVEESGIAYAGWEAVNDMGENNNYLEGGGVIVWLFLCLIIAFIFLIIYGC